MKFIQAVVNKARVETQTHRLRNRVQMEVGGRELSSTKRSIRLCDQGIELAGERQR